jgi:hypothetical protein
LQGCSDQGEQCQATCSNNVAYLSPASEGGASLWNPPLAAPGACVDVSVSERAPTIATPSAEL